MTRVAKRRRMLRLLVCCALAASAAWAGSDAGEPLTGFHREWVWSVFGTKIGREGFEIVDFDGVGGPELLAATSGGFYTYTPGSSDRWFIARFDGDFRQIWSSFSYPEGVLRVRTIRSGPSIEIAVATGSELSGSDLRIYDGATRAELRSFDLPGGETRSFVGADFSGTGVTEIAVCDERDLFLLDYLTGTVVATRYGFGCEEIAAGQLDGDAALEIVLAGNPLGGFVLDGSTLDLQWAALDGFPAPMRLSDVDADGRLEILHPDPQGNELLAVDGESGATLWSSPTGLLQGLGLADADLDGNDEIIFGSNAYPSCFLRVLEESNGLEWWSVELPVCDVIGIAGGDLDSDGDLELVATAGSDDGCRMLAVSAADHSVEASSRVLYGPFPGLSVGDVDADLRPELVTGSFLSHDGLGSGRVLAFDLGVRSLEYVGPDLGGEPFSPIVIGRVLAGQTDADPQLEICLIAENTFPTASEILCEDGSSHAEEWSMPFPDAPLPLALALAPLSSPERLEVLVTTPPTVSAFDGETGAFLWSTPPVSGLDGYYFLRAAELTPEPGVEIVTGGGHPFCAKVAVFSASGTLLGGPHAPDVCAFDTAPLGPGPAHALAVSRTDGRIETIDPVSGAPIQQLAVLSGPATALRIGDVSRDGVPDIVATVDSRIIVWGGAEGAVLWTSPFLREDAGASDALTLDFSRPGAAPRILVDTGAGFAVFEAPLIVLLSDGFESGDTSAWTLAVPGQGLAERRIRR